MYNIIYIFIYANIDHLFILYFDGYPIHTLRNDCLHFSGFTSNILQPNLFWGFQTQDSSLNLKSAQPKN